MTTNHETQTAPGARAGVIKLGLDVHASSIVVVRQIDAQASQPTQKFTPEQFPAFVRRQLARAQTVHSCYEAGPFGYVLHRQLEALGVRNLVVRPRDWSTYGEECREGSGREECREGSGRECSCGRPEDSRPDPFASTPGPGDQT